MSQEQNDPARQLEELILRHGDDVLRYAYLYLGDRGWAEDASQQVFLKVYRNLSGFRREASERTWILRITINTCKNIRSSRAYKKELAECSLDALEHLGSGENLAGRLEDREIWQEVLSLPGSYRDVVLLKYYHGYPSEEIAVLLGISHSAVRTRLSRAMEKLRGRLERRPEYNGFTAEKQSCQHCE